MKNDNLKEVFFAQYWGQKVLNVFLNNGEYELINLKEKVYPYNQEDHLLLKSVKDISNKDAYGVGIKVNCWSWVERRMDFFEDDEMKDTHIASGRNFAHSIGTEYGWGMSHPFADNVTDILSAYDFLRSKGYCLPFMGLSIDKLIDLGWVKIIKNESNNI